MGCYPGNLIFYSTAPHACQTTPSTPDNANPYPGLEPSTNHALSNVHSTRSTFSIAMFVYVCLFVYVCMDVCTYACVYVYACLCVCANGRVRFGGSQTLFTSCSVHAEVYSGDPPKHFLGAPVFAKALTTTPAPIFTTTCIPTATW